MEQKQSKKKTDRSSGSGGSSLELSDVASQVPAVDDVLAQLDAALKTATQLNEKLKPRDSCRCGY